MIRLNALRPCADAGTPDADNATPTAKAANANFFIRSPYLAS
jgi:hypothetical protein